MLTRALRRSFLLVPIAALAAAPAAQSRRAESRPTDAAAALRRVVTIGASLTDGFGNGLPPARVLDRVIRSEHQPVAQVSGSAFFANPIVEGRRQVQQVLRKKPTLVIAADYLFWFAYGHVPGSSQRAREKDPATGQAVVARVEPERAVQARRDLLEKGLAELARLDVPIVVGDLPDMWGADPTMLSPFQVPDARTIDALNERIRAWAKERGNVCVLPMGRWAAAMRDGKLDVPASGGGRGWQTGSKDLLQWDRLHPSRPGIVALCAGVVMELRAFLGPGADAALAMDPAAVLETLGEDVPGDGAASGPAGSRPSSRPDRR